LYCTVYLSRFSKISNIKVDYAFSV
jgi:hypothetical protein